MSAGKAIDTELNEIRERLSALENVPPESPAPIPLPPHPEPDPEPIPPTDGDMLWQIGVNSVKGWSGEDPFINVIKQGAGNHPEGAFDEATQSFADDVSNVVVAAIRDGATVNPEHYKGDWIIEWDGSGSLSTKWKGAGRNEVEATNRIRNVFDGSVAGRAGVYINKPGGVSNIRVYRAEHEDLYKAGQVFAPHFLEHVSKYDIVRPLDWSGGSVSKVTKASELKSLKDQFWGSGIVPFEVQFTMAKEAEVSLWLNLPPRIGALDGLNERLMLIGDQKERVAIIADHFDAVDASPEWDNFARAVVEAMEATDYPVERHFYLELANETWNWGGAFGFATEWYWALTGGLAEKTGKKYTGNPTRGAYGYFSARLAEAFAKALYDAGRSDQQWTMVIGSHTANPAQTAGPLQGLKDYTGGPFKQPMARYGVSVTGYYGGLFHNRGAMRLFDDPAIDNDDNAWRAEWLRRFNEDRDAFEQFLFDKMAGDGKIQNINWIVRRSLQHKGIAESFGARFIGQYEGSSHDSLDKKVFAKDPEIVKFHKDWHTGERNADIIRLHAKLMSENFPGAILSNYLSHSLEGLKADRPWIEGTPWGEETEADMALDEMIDQH